MARVDMERIIADALRSALRRSLRHRSGPFAAAGKRNRNALSVGTRSCDLRHARARRQRRNRPSPHASFSAREADALRPRATLMRGRARGGRIGESTLWRVGRRGDERAAAESDRRRR
jgi:hypothetical protein